MDWLPIVAVIAPVVASLGTLLLTQRHADKAAERQGMTDRERWEFEARERRFDNRLAAVTALHELAERTHLATWEWYQSNPEYKEPEPSEGPPGVPKDLGARVARVVMLGTPPVVRAAQDLYVAVAHEYLGEEADYFHAANTYQEACRAMLTERAESAQAALPSNQASAGNRARPSGSPSAPDI